MDPGELWIYNDQCNPHGNAGKEDDPAVDGSDGCADGSDGCRTVSTGQRTISEKHAQAKLRLLQALEEVPERYLSMDIVRQRLNISSVTLKAMQQEKVIAVISKERYRTAGIYDYKEEFQITLNKEQQIVVDEITHDMEQGHQQTYLLHGITGSGKTEVYVNIVKKTVEMGKQAIVLIPEIALTYQTVRYFRNYFGDRVTILNSRLSDGEKYDQFMRAKNGDVDVVIGPRSALFAPFQNLGIIIIDEEHESSYKSDYPPKYHARETAVKGRSLNMQVYCLVRQLRPLRVITRHLTGHIVCLNCMNVQEADNSQRHQSLT